MNFKKEYSKEAVASRTTKSLKNAKIALVYYFINLALQFFSRKYFLNYLGAEILGLNTTAMNLLQFLNLAELGIGVAISYSLYKPLADKNEEEINEIVSIQGYIYRRIGIIIILCSTILMLFFPYFFSKAHVSIIYAYATFIVLLIAALLGYFFNYKQIVLTADQKDYKLYYSVQSIKVVKLILQIISIVFFSHGYVYWLLIELGASFISVYSINYAVKKEYPWLRTNLALGKSLQKKYPEIFRKTKQLFFHKIGTFVLFETSPLVIYAYTSLTLVAIYGNYMLIVTGVMALLNAVFNSVGAGVGNLVAEGDQDRIMRIFRELFSSRFLFVSSICFGVYMLSTPFMIYWVGEEFLIDNLSLLLIVAVLFINTMRNVVDIYINAYGLFQDVWAPIAEACLNLLLSVVLGYFYGLHGVLIGVLLSLIIVVFMWKPYFLFHKGMKRPVREYVLIYVKHLSALIIVCTCIYLLLPHISIDPIKSVGNFVSYSIIIIVVFFFSLFLSLFFLEREMRSFAVRLKRVILNSRI